VWLSLLFEVLLITWLSIFLERLDMCGIKLVAPVAIPERR